MAGRGEQDVMDAAGLRECCLSFEGAYEDFPFGPETSVFKVAGKLFAISALGRSPLSVSLKCEPDVAVGLRGAYPAITPGYHLNKRHWNTVLLDGSLPDSMVRDMVEDSYDLVVEGLPLRVQAGLRAGGAAGHPRAPLRASGDVLGEARRAPGHSTRRGSGA